MLLSICIPAYKRTDYLERLLTSLINQTFRDFEVVITDDSPGDEVRLSCEPFKKQLQLTYYKNPEALGTPENWNQAIRLAKGDWIKLMHDDDWFTSPGSLDQFATAIYKHSQKSFFYSAYNNVYADGRIEPIYINAFRKRKLESNPVTLFSKNVIGPPSVILVRRDLALFYDKRMKWMVDVDFYIRVLQAFPPPVFIPSVLVNVGIHPTQVTSYTFRVQEVEIPENFWLLEKVGEGHLHNILIYDAWWRIVRNLKIISLGTIQKFGYSGPIPNIIQSMIRVQSSVPARLLKIGPISKTIMFVHYLVHKGKIKR